MAAERKTALPLQRFRPLFALIAEGAARREQDRTLPFDEVAARYGHVDAVIHSAGLVAYGRLEEVPAKVFDRVLQTNLLGDTGQNTFSVRQELPAGSSLVVPAHHGPGGAEGHDAVDPQLPLAPRQFQPKPTPQPELVLRRKQSQHRRTGVSAG